MKTIYCISGLGADERVFSNIRVPGYVLQPIRWQVPLPGETLTAYASRMSEAITEPEPILLGLSFGGIMSIEIARLLPVKAVVIVSSVKNTRELPRWMRLAGRLKLDKVVPLKSFKLMEPIQNYKLGVTNEAERQMALEYRRNANRTYINWAVNQVLNWQNDWQPPVLYHIHGTKDRMFPFKRIQPSCSIPGGGHLMILNKAAEINQYLAGILPG